MGLSALIHEARQMQIIIDKQLMRIDALRAENEKLTGALAHFRDLTEYIANNYPLSDDRESACEAVETILEEVTRLREYVGTNDIRSDYQTVDHMRQAIDHLNKELEVSDYDATKDRRNGLGPQ